MCSSLQRYKTLSNKKDKCFPIFISQELRYACIDGCTDEAARKDLLKKREMKFVSENNLLQSSMEVGGMLLALLLVFLFCRHPYFNDHLPNTYIDNFFSIKLSRILCHNLFSL